MSYLIHREHGEILEAYKKGNIKVEVSGGTPVSVPAIITGSFGIHRSLNLEGEPRGPGWTITQIPTGFAVASHLRKKEIAVQLAEKLSALGGNEWKKKSPQFSGEVEEKMQTAVRAAKGIS